MTTESLTASTYLYNTLSGDSQLAAYGITGYFNGSAPPLQAGPYILWTFAGAADNNTMEGYRVNTAILYIVRAVMPTRDYSNLQPMAERIDALLDRSSGAASGHAIDACLREAPYELIEDRGDLQWRHLGGRYRIWVSSS